jgi:hypothetical protein
LAFVCRREPIQRAIQCDHVQRPPAWPRSM